ncbi:hypothetical protein [Parasitella parasitica]|uniref:C3H1-type domain-containing protein n=1 Tax=Parasitella parasitica TaxID=35722 RepID=A0A0B7NEA7_9FUNG|nr:hypothetical protein [Parasitella parasitica]
MRGFSTQLRTKQGAIIGAGVVIVITAITIWSWKSSSSSKKDNESPDERSVKTKKDSVAKEQNDMVVEQSQIKKDDQISIVVKEEANTSVNKFEDLSAEKKNEDLEEKFEVVEKKKVVVVADTVTEVVEGQYDEFSSIKSHNLSATTSSADETDICTPEHEANTVTDVKHPKSSAQIDTHNNNLEKVNFDWTEESIKAVLPPINRDIITVSPSDADTTETIATTNGTEPQQLESTSTTTAIESQQSKQKEQEEYVVIDHPAEQISIKEQVIASPVAVTTISTEEEPVVSEKVQDSSTPSSVKSTTPLSSSLTANAPEFIPKSHQQHKKLAKKFLTREQLIEQQRQHHMPRSKARCSHWPHCTNNNCKFFHPYRPCRAGDECSYGDRCMFVHPNDCAVNVRDNNKNTTAINTSIPA